MSKPELHPAFRPLSDFPQVREVRRHREYANHLDKVLDRVIDYLTKTEEEIGELNAEIIERFYDRETPEADLHALHDYLLVLETKQKALQDEYDRLQTLLGETVDKAKETVARFAPGGVTPEA